MSRLARLVGAVLALSVEPSLFGSDHPNSARGYSPEKTFQMGDLDSVNGFTGGLSLAIPIGGAHKGGGNLEYSLSLFYNASVWDYQEREDEISGVTYTQALPVRAANAGLGFSLHLGRLLAPWMPENDNGGNITYLAIDGSEHAFYGKAHASDLEDPGDTPTSQNVLYSRDGSYLRLRVLSGGQAREVDFPGGEVHHFDDAWRLRWIRDGFSNQLTINYDTPGEWALSDGFRTHKIVFTSVQVDNQSVQAVQRVELAGGLTYSFKYASTQIPRTCSPAPDSDPMTSAMVQVSLLESVTLPDGSSLRMSYYTSPTDTGATCRSVGALRSLTLATLGRLEYTWRDYTFAASSGRAHQTITAGIATRKTVGADGATGVWTYTTTLIGGPASFTDLLNTVTDPAGTRTERWFVPRPTITTYSLPFTLNQSDGGRYLSTEVFDSAGTRLRSSYVVYEMDQTFTPQPGDLPDQIALNRRELSTHTIYRDDTPATRFASIDRSQYDGLGHYRTETTGGSFAAANVRTTKVDYNSARGVYSIDQATNQPTAQHDFTMLPSSALWVLGTYISRRVDEGGTVDLAEYCFDPATGFLLGRRSRLNAGGRDSKDAVVLYTATVKNGAPGWPSDGDLGREEYFGGDSGGVSTSSACGVSVTNQVRIDHQYQAGIRTRSHYVDGGGAALSFFLLDQDIEPLTGLVTATRDSAGLQTSFEYEGINDGTGPPNPVSGRLRFVKPAEEAWTEYVYTNATSASLLAQVQVQRRPNGGGNPLTESVIKLDGFGRMIEEQHRMPNNTMSVRKTHYDSSGRRDWVSELGNTNKKTLLEFDAFGRTTKIDPPDGDAKHIVTFSYTGISSVKKSVNVYGSRVIAGTPVIDEYASRTTSIFDRQGRLYQVKEPADTNDADTTTTYSYDAADRLRTVSQTGSVGPQTRSFTYDGRGFLTGETHPEKGATGNGTLTNSVFDARGRARDRIDGSSKLRFTYDRAERLQRVDEIVGTGTRPLKVFTFGISNPDRSNGKVLTATRSNYPAAPLSGTYEVVESFTYLGLEGRVSRKHTQLTGGGEQMSFVQTFSYDPLGPVETLGYPECTFAACTDRLPRPVKFGYTKGRLTSVAGFASSITYHANGLIDRVKHSNGIDDLQGNDPDWMPRPSSSSAQRTADGAILWGSGTYAYDGAGNVARIGGSYFLYDLVSRAVDGHVYDGPTGGGTLRFQTYNYDPFGNLKSIGGDPVAPGRTTDTSPTTNHLTAGAFDGAGNLTGWNGNLYDYDALGMMARMRTGTLPSSEDWRYFYTANDERIHARRLAPAGSPGSIWTLRDLEGNVLRQYDAHVSWTTVRDYVYRDGQLLASSYPGEGVRHFSLDHLGTPRLVTNSGGGESFYTLTPCRVLDTRSQGGAINAGETRSVAMAGICGIPSGASAVSVNLTVVTPTAQGELTAFPADEARPTTSAISYRAGIVRANNGVLKLGGDALAFYANQSSGNVHLIIDVNGYFKAVPAAAVAYHAYFPFGEEITSTTQDIERRKFTGHERDFANLASVADDLDYLHARHYNPLTGRFLSTDRFDVLGLQSGDILDQEEFLEYLRQPQSWNRYGYAKGNPLKYVDLDGRTATLAVAAPALFGGGGGTSLSALAAANPVGAVVVVGGVAYGLGSLINEIPGVSDAIQGGLGAVLDSIYMRGNTKQVNSVVRSPCVGGARARQDEQRWWT